MQIPSHDLLGVAQILSKSYSTAASWFYRSFVHPNAWALNIIRGEIGVPPTKSNDKIDAGWLRIIVF